MTRLSDLLEDAIGPVAAPIEFEPIRRRARRRRTHTRLAAASLACATAIGVVAIVATTRTGPAKRGVQLQTPTTLPDVLVFDDFGGVLAVDVDARLAAHHLVDGWRAGDQPFFSILVGNDIVVGWGDVFAAPIAGGPSRNIGSGVVVPAAEPGAVWLTSYGQEQHPTERLVDMQGHVLLEGRTPATGTALVGVPGGLAIQTTQNSSIDIWDAHTGRITRHLASHGPGEAAPAHGSLLAWCDRCNRAVELTDLTTGVTREVAIPLNGDSLTMSHAAFSPNGTQLAVATRNRGEVEVIDVASPKVVDRIAGRASYPAVAWSADSQRLYIASDVGGNETHIVVRESADGTTRDLGAIPGAFYQLKAIPRVDARTLLDAPRLGSAAACIPPPTGPKTDTPACSFKF